MSYCVRDEHGALRCPEQCEGCAWTEGMPKAVPPEGRFTQVGHINVNEYGFVSASAPDLKVFDKAGEFPIFIEKK